MTKGGLYEFDGLELSLFEYSIFLEDEYVWYVSPIKISRSTIRNQRYLSEEDVSSFVSLDNVPFVAFNTNL